MFDVVPGVIGFSTAGIERMRITQSNVGIFNSNPQYTLDVGGTINALSNITAPNITTLSNVSYLGSAAATFGSNLSVSTSNYVYETVFGGYSFSSNTAVAASNQAFDSWSLNGPSNVWTSRNVGIQTSNPAFALDVNGVIHTDDYIVVHANNNPGYDSQPYGYGLYCVNSNLGTSNTVGLLLGKDVVNSGNNAFMLFTEYSNANPYNSVGLGIIGQANAWGGINVNYLGNVGINQQYAQYKLDVVGDVNISGGTLRSNGVAYPQAAIGWSTSGSNIISGAGSNVSVSNVLYLNNSGTTIFTTGGACFRSSSGAPDSGIQQNAAGLMQFYAPSNDGAEGFTFINSARNKNIVTISDAGNVAALGSLTASNVGVNLTSASIQYTLDVAGSAQVRSNIYVPSGTQNLVLTAESGTTLIGGCSNAIQNAASIGVAGRTYSSGGYLANTCCDNGFITFSTINAAGTATEYMRMNGAGNFGIGTMTPTYNLDVVGTAYLGSLTCGSNIVSKAGVLGPSLILNPGYFDMLTAGLTYPLNLEGGNNTVNGGVMFQGGFLGGTDNTGLGLAWNKGYLLIRGCRQGTLTTASSNLMYVRQYSTAGTWSNLTSGFYVSDYGSSYGYCANTSPIFSLATGASNVPLLGLYCASPSNVTYRVGPTYIHLLT